MVIWNSHLWWRCIRSLDFNYMTQIWHNYLQKRTFQVNTKFSNWQFTDWQRHIYFKFRFFQVFSTFYRKAVNHLKNISPKQLSSVIGEENVRKIIEAFPGGRFYVRNNYLDVKERNEIIRKDFYSGDLDRNQLAEKYNLSLSAIDKIIGKNRKRNI